jgi:hypothetical protein
MTQLSKQCPSCKYFLPDETGFRCEAFLDKDIPYDILTGNFRHIKKHPEQDNDILWERKE